jgi:hypothetical protein
MSVKRREAGTDGLSTAREIPAAKGDQFVATLRSVVEQTLVETSRLRRGWTVQEGTAARITGTTRFCGGSICCPRVANHQTENLW